MSGSEFARIAFNGIQKPRVFAFESGRCPNARSPIVFGAARWPREIVHGGEDSLNAGEQMTIDRLYDGAEVLLHVGGVGRADDRGGNAWIRH